MIEIEQTKLLYPDGNCYAACVASVLECAIDDVPQPTAEEGASKELWHDYELRLSSWLQDRGLDLVTFPYQEGGWKPSGYALLGADSPRGNWLHSVVTFNGRVVWDPHPQRDMGLGERRDWTIFYTLNAARS